MLQSIYNYSRACGIAESTARLHAATLESFFKFTQKEHSKTTTDDVRRWLRRTAKTVSPATVSLRLGMLRKFFYWLDSDPKKNPCNGISLPRRDVGLPNVDPEQVRLLLETFQGRTPIELRDEAMVRLLSESGMRVQRLLNLRVSEWSGLGVSPDCSKTIERYLATFRSMREKSGSDRLFISVCGGDSLTRQSLWKAISSHGARAGLQNMSPEKVRNMMIRRAMEEGDLSRGEVLMKIAGKSKKKASPMRENEIQTQIREALGEVDGVFLFRNSVGVAREVDKSGQERVIRYGLGVGSADLVGLCDGRFFCLEIKAQDGVLNARQEEWRDLIRKYGGFYAEARSVDDALRAVRECREKT